MKKITSILVSKIKKKKTNSNNSMLSIKNVCTDYDYQQYYDNPENTAKKISDNVVKVIGEYCSFCEKTSVFSSQYVCSIYSSSLKFHDHKRSDLFYPVVNYLWQNSNYHKELKNIFEKFFDSPDTHNPKCSRVWLTYMMYLLEEKKEEECVKTFEEYIKIFGFAKVHQYLPLSAFLFSKGYDNELIKRSSDLFENIIRGYEKFKYLVEDKTIAVVGNGPKEIGTGHGPEIDDHDMVIRFNNYKTRDFEKDYGSKIDIWARNMIVDGLIHTASKSKIIIFEPDIYRFWIRDNVLNDLYTYIFDYNISVCNMNYRDELTNMLDGFPTTGLLVIYNLYKIKKSIKKMDLYGFTLPEDKVNIADHYYEKNDSSFIMSSMHHSLNKESKIIKGIVETW